MLSFDPFAIVSHMHNQHLLNVVEAHNDQDSAPRRSELDRIFYQIDEHLLQSDLVSDQPWKANRFPVHIQVACDLCFWRKKLLSHLLS